MKTRIQLDITNEEVNEIEKAMADTRANTRREFYDNAVTFFIWAIEESKKGSKIYARAKDGSEKQLVMTPLERASRNER